MKESLLKQVVPLGLIIGFRFFGLFVVMPLLALYVSSLEGATSFLVGLAIGGYALTQLFFQIPFGFLSDRVGRKGIIGIGLLIFAIGSLICVLSENIYVLILGRFLQGAGAIGGVVSAMIADLVKEELRTKAMAFMGGIISLSFSAALIIGPTLGVIYGVKSLFGITCVLALLGIGILIFFVSDSPKIIYNFNIKETAKGSCLTKGYKSILFNKNLQILNLTNFLQKGFMTLAFLIIPLALVGNLNLSKEYLYAVYIPASILGFLAMIPAAIVAEKKGKFKMVLVVGVIFFILAYLLMLSDNKWIFITGILIFFIGFSVHEPIMQSLASRYCKTHQKGGALGIFTSFGYLGSFVSAVIGGYFYGHFGISVVSLCVIILSLAWIACFLFLDSPTLQKNLYLPLREDVRMEQLMILEEINGVLEWYVNQNEHILVVKYQQNLKENVLEGVREKMLDFLEASFLKEDTTRI